MSIVNSEFVKNLSNKLIMKYNSYLTNICVKLRNEVLCDIISITRVGNIMNFKNLSDSHLHTNCSFDGENSVEEMCSKAIKRGLYAVTITDHCECPMIDQVNCEYGDFNKLIPESLNLIEKAQDKFTGKLIIFKGIELGEPLHNLNNTKKALQFGEYDFILASVHNLQDREDFYFMEYQKDSVPQILHSYFKEVLDTARWNDFDSLAHLTYPLRYIVGRSKIPVDLSEYTYEIDSILNVLIKNNKALEINVSGLRSEIGVTMPDLNVIKRYKQLGGRYITLGSDAHKTSDLAKGLEEGAKLILNAGFTEYTIYKNHKPILMKIE